MRRLLCAVRFSAGLATGLAAAGCGDASDPATAPHAPSAPAVPLAKPPEPRGPERRSDAEVAETIAREQLRSAWAAVRERGRLLARRGQRATIHGRVGDPVEGAPHRRWLVDDTDGDGSLAVPVELSPAVDRELSPGQRALVTGAWTIASDGRWAWRADRVAIAPGTDASPFGHPPGRRVETVPASDVPEAARGPGQPGPAGPVLVTVVGRPVRFGDGWPVADAAGDEPVAYLRLPGERPVYGGDELLADDERWPLRVGERYLVDSEPVKAPHRTTLPLVRTGAPPRRVVTE